MLCIIINKISWDDSKEGTEIIFSLMTFAAAPDWSSLAYKNIKNFLHNNFSKYVFTSYLENDWRNSLTAMDDNNVNKNLFYRKKEKKRCSGMFILLFLTKREQEREEK